MLDDARVAITPGEAFDAPGFFRLSYATSMEELRRGSERILAFLKAMESRKAIAR
jgi:aspartate aminotransferase